MNPARKLLLAAIALGIGLLLWRGSRSTPSPGLPPTPTASPPASGQRNDISPELAAELAAIEARERSAAETVWAPELQAQQRGRIIDDFWNRFRAATNKLLFATLPPAEQILVPGKFISARGPANTTALEPGAGTKTITPQEWTTWIRSLSEEGWTISQIELRHQKYDPPAAGRPESSECEFSAHLLNQSRNDRLALSGILKIQWRAPAEENQESAALRIDASSIRIQSRHGDPPLRLELSRTVSPPRNAYSIDPLIFQDLDGDGLPEIILAGRNEYLRRKSDGTYSAAPLSTTLKGLISTAVIADFDSDGFADLLAVGDPGLLLLKGDANPGFHTPPRIAWRKVPDLKYAMVLTAGDVDADGDLDLFLAQYKVPYENGSMPTPFHDARDGYPCFLLRNDGHGNFEDATEAAGLGSHRFRRTYSASLADMNSDGSLDLAVISDFAGIDLFLNNGRGQFREATSSAIGERHAFGMAHLFDDFNRDGFTDLLMMGMTSPTASRLNHAGLTRGDQMNEMAMRMRMTHGNHLYLGTSTGRFLENDLSSSISRSGWSWGCTSFDLENDGYPDVYIGNGLESRDSVTDYESEYWLHDAYVGKSEETPGAYLYFKSKFTRTRGRGQSYGGYEKNRLFLNMEGKRFVETAHVLGVALENDTRNVASEDLDGDGRMDLIQTCFEEWPDSSQSLKIHRNITHPAGNWIGFRFRQGPGQKSPMGATLILETEAGSTRKHVVSGDSHRTQHSSTIHLGLGDQTSVRKVKISWPDGSSVELSAPGVGRYHWLETGKSTASPGQSRNP